MKRSEPIPEADSHRLLATEVAYVLDHASQSLSAQNRRILKHLAQTRFDDGADQYDIAIECLKLDKGFQPDVDALVRVAVSRLRTALERFYNGPGQLRQHRLYIPNVRYCLNLKPNVMDCGPRSRDEKAVPCFAWTVSAANSPTSREVAFQIEKTFPTLLAQAPLLHDGAIRSEWLASRSIEAALDNAKDASIAMLAELIVGTSDDPFVVRVWNVQQRKIVSEKRSNPPLPVSDVSSLLKTALVYLTDPLTGVLPTVLARIAPKSRLAAAQVFFRFMATQNRNLLASAHQNLLDVKGTNLDSALLAALRIDSFRSNYSFATGTVETVSEEHLDQAERVVELDPFQPYARLARSYYDLLLNGTCAADPADNEGQQIEWVGSAQTDLHLHRALVGRTEPSPVAPNTVGSFFSNASAFLTSFGNEDFHQAEEFAFCDRVDANFWMRAFQCAVSVQLGDTKRATCSYSALKTEVPGFEDFAGRALSSMLPDERVRGRICSNLASLT